VINNPTPSTLQGIGLSLRHPDGERADQAEADVGGRFFFLE
jgi:hypothetical protein